VTRPRLLVALALLAVTAGCLGGGAVSDQELDADPPASYEWDAGVDAHITVTEGARFQAVYRMNSSQVELYRNDGLGGRNAIPVEAFRYRYPDGTVVSGSEFRARGGAVDRSRDGVTVELPANVSGGQIAFTSSSTPKRFRLPVYVEGSYELVLPPDRRTSFPIFGSVRPRAESVQIPPGDDRVHIRWSNLAERQSISIQFYLQRDLYVFAAIITVLVVVAAGGLYRYKRQIEALEQQREELGLDVETEDDDFGRDPPPGMG
jgi:hypothetical protein